jgi:hypothetical protein
LLEEPPGSVGRYDEGGLALAFAALAERSPDARERALSLRARLFEGERHPPFAFYQRRWIGHKAQQPALESVLAPMPRGDGCDSWLGSLALCAPGVDPVERRWWFWTVSNEAAFDLRQEPRVPECPGSVIRIGMEDPVVLTAWVALTLEAIREALRAR